METVDIRRSALAWSWPGWMALVLVAGCGEGPSLVVPADHPCPELALAPVMSSDWAALVGTSELAPLPLRLPLALGTSAVVTQGNAQGPTHLESVAYAWDFGVPEATPVVAAAPGVVVWVRDDSTVFGDDAAVLDAANWIVLDHGGGLFSSST